MTTAEETIQGVIEDALQAQSDVAYSAGVDVTLDYCEAVLLSDPRLELIVISAIFADIRRELQRE